MWFYHTSKGSPESYSTSKFSLLFTHFVIFNHKVFFFCIFRHSSTLTPVQIHLICTVKKEVSNSN